MDSHSFRIIGDELLELLDGARLEKIHGPRPGVLTFSFFTGEKKRHLLFRFERQAPLLFFSEQRLANPERPSATVMRLRKYCAGRRLGRGILDYAARRLAFPVHVPPGDAPCWLLLDMVEGAFVHGALPESLGRESVWPDPVVVDALCFLPWQKGGATKEVWQDYAVLTPLLRETLAALEALDGKALLVDLETGGGGLFLYADQSGKAVLYTAWPLPEALCERRGITPHPEESLFSLQGEAYPALTASALIDEPKFFAELGRAVYKETGAPVRKASKKQSRLLAKLDQEHKRLTAMLAQRENAVALQEVLWQYAPDARLESVDVDGGENGPPRRIELNSLLSVRENMTRMFKESARGARGLAMLEARRAEVLAAPPEAAGEDGLAGAATAAPRRSPVEGVSGTGEIKNVGRFRSADGFIMLRGKNARGNQSLLKIGAPQDLWLHAEDGPSAHLIIRRSHAAEEIPESTLREAALLVAEKSWQRHDARARIMVALLRHVHAVKGAAPGTVRVDTVLRGLVVSLVT